MTIVSTEDCLFLECSNLPLEDDCFRLGAHYCEDVFADEVWIVPVFAEVRTVTDPSIIVELDAVLSWTSGCRVEGDYAELILVDLFNEESFSSNFHDYHLSRLDRGEGENGSNCEREFWRIPTETS